MLDLPTKTDADVGPILLFVRSSVDLQVVADAAIAAARAGEPAWVAYPKAGQLGTDLNRDRIWKILLEHGIRPIRQVAIDETWSALRFRPA